MCLTLSLQHFHLSTQRCSHTFTRDKEIKGYPGTGKEKGRKSRRFTVKLYLRAGMGDVKGLQHHRMNLGLGLAPVAGSGRGAQSVPKPLREEPQRGPPSVP